MNAPGFLPPEHFNPIFSAHGTMMIFFVAMPLVIGLMNFVVPLQLGLRDVAFPMLNSVGFWLTATGALLVKHFARGRRRGDTMDEDSIRLPDEATRDRVSPGADGGREVARSSTAPVARAREHRLPKMTSLLQEIAMLDSALPIWIIGAPLILAVIDLMRTPKSR